MDKDIRFVQKKTYAGVNELLRKKALDLACGLGANALLLAEAVGPEGKVYAVDISPGFLEAIAQRAQSRGLDNVVTVLGDQKNANLPRGELDRVYINIAGRDMSATLGDFHLRYDDTEFGRYNRKLSGVLGEARQGAARGAVSFATLNGTYHSLQFNGIDGVQGPYRLTGRNGEQPILVLGSAFPGQENDILKYQLTPVIYDLAGARR